MPFSRYLQEDDPPPRQKEFPFSTNTLDIQIPPFLYQNPVPTLAHGGGAEVVTFSPSWFTNSFPSPTHHIHAQPPGDPVIPPSSAGLPVYSASGFDLLSLLARVATRSNPQVHLGPVDMTCSFVVVDTRRYDHPIVYCSPSFCHLTGYEEHEILGRNCRFLQAPGGAIKKGETRRFTSQDPVRAMHKNLSQDKEVQTSIVNFRKDGTAFINLVTVIPIPGGVKGEAHEKNEVVWHIGFQVDLTEQPGVIVDKANNGTYVVDQQTAGLWNSQLLISKDATTTAAVVDTNKKKTSTAIPQIRVSEPLNRALRMSSSNPDHTSNHPLSFLLLSHAPDFIHVVSLKGLFLYIAPAVSRILGYDPLDLLNKTMSDIAHPEDIVPLERQLKESSTLFLLGPESSDPSFASSAPGALGAGAHATTTTSALISTSPSAQPRPVDLVFRARTKQGRYVWLECRGRLHVEPGKGRKAIILSGRAREMASVKWGDVKEMARGPTITRALIQNALAAGTGGGTGAASEEMTTDPANTDAVVNAGTKRRRESSESAPPLSLPPPPELPSLPAKTTKAVHPHSRPLPGASSSSSFSSTSPTSPAIPPLTPPASSRHTEFWGMLSGLGHASGSFISLSRGVSDVLGWHGGGTAALLSAAASPPTSGDHAANGGADGGDAAAVGSLAQQRQAQQRRQQHQQQQRQQGEFDIDFSGELTSSGNGGAGSMYHHHHHHHHQGGVIHGVGVGLGSSGSGNGSGSMTTTMSSGGGGGGPAPSSSTSVPLSSLGLRDALIGRRLRDLIVSESNFLPASGYANSSAMYNEAASFGIRPRNKGKESSGGDVREIVEGALRAWEEERRTAEATDLSGQQGGRRQAFPPPIYAPSFDSNQPPRARGKGKNKSVSLNSGICTGTGTGNTVTVRCWMKAVNSRGEWNLHAPFDGSGNVVPVVVTLYRATVAPMCNIDMEMVAKGVAAIREATAADNVGKKAEEELDVASPPTLVQVRIDTSRTGESSPATPVSSASASEVETPAFTSAGLAFGPSANISSSSSMSITCSSSDLDNQASTSTNRSHPADANIFAELETGRGSSWQYELQQMRIQNRKMLDEIVGMEEVLSRGKELSADSAEEVSRDLSIDIGVGSTELPKGCEDGVDDDDIVEMTSPSVRNGNVFTTSPVAEEPSPIQASTSTIPQGATYEYPSYGPLSPLLGYNGMVDNMYAPNPLSSSGANPVIASGGYQQYEYPQQQQQNTSHQGGYDYGRQQQTQQQPQQAGPYGYDDGYGQPQQYQNAYSAHPQYLQHQETYLDGPMASPTSPDYPQSQQAQYTLHQPQPQHQRQGLDWGTAPTSHHYQQRRRSVFGGQ